MRYMVFTDIVPEKKSKKAKEDITVRSDRMKAEWVNKFSEVEKKMELPEYVGYVPETRWCKG